MIQHQIKLRLSRKQEQTIDQWLFHLTSVWNFAIRKIELNAKDRMYFSAREFQNLLANHGEKLGIPSHTLHGMHYVFEISEHGRSLVDSESSSESLQRAVLSV